ncbi:hypothetical protein CTAYLR_008880 [Chrysophaeum taylorii]|uniref:Major facilitator superfamily (MFS) profile domain-containing protein n=1 Tax=Chrysophaeum taylorii TaxID=2483200 RepID=A0AAD7U8E6_9STRA|nr:hypothetical protein CTAYLR_008880 [Chrysophaeum taylorii]
MAPTYDPHTGLNVPVVAVYLVFLVIFLDTIGATISTPALPYYAAKFGCTNAQIGYLFGAWSLTSTCFAPILGRLADVVGRRTVLLMSLVGAGAAAIAQGVAPNYSVLLLARGFSGIWAAVGSTAQVYLADSCSPAMLPIYMARLSSVPGLAMIFGPGLGGGLSKFGLNVPIIVDGCVSLFSSILVLVYMPESVAWLASQSKEKSEDKNPTETSPLHAAEGGATVDTVVEEPPKPPDTHHKTLALLCLSQMFNGITFSTIVSMLAVSLAAKLDFDALRVGYTFVGLAVVMVFTAVWLTPVAQKKLGIEQAAVLATVVTAVALVWFALADTVLTVLLALAVSRCAQSLRGASFGTIVTQATTIQTRGTTLARVQLFLNGGRLIGPLVAGNLANFDPERAPWYLAAAASFVSAALLQATVKIQPAQTAPAGHGRHVEDLDQLMKYAAVVQAEIARHNI